MTHVETIGGAIGDVRSAQLHSNDRTIAVLFEQTYERIELKTPHQNLPTAWEEREVLRERGQFWTPDWVAEPMVRFALGGGAAQLFDPAVGPGTFLLAAQRLAGLQEVQPVSLAGRDIDAEVVQLARTNGLGVGADVEIRDFVLSPPPHGTLPAIVANPPYIRHHRLDRETKDQLRAMSIREFGLKLDGRAGFHFYFFLTALRSLKPGGKLCFIMSADTAEGLSARAMWSRVASEFRLDAVVTFTADATPFPGVDTNALVYCITRSDPKPHFKWIEVTSRSLELGAALSAIGAETELQTDFADLTIANRDVSEAVATGLSRPPFQHPIAAKLGDFVSVMRGVVAGDSEFFFLDDDGVATYNLPEEYLTPVVPRTRDITGNEFTSADFRSLGELGRRRWLFSVEDLADIPESVGKYLDLGIERGLDRKPILAARGSRWFRSEKRRIPDFFFAYLGRRNQRFIRNRTDAIPSTAFLCIYVKPEWSSCIESVSELLNDTTLIANLKFVGKSYGGGAIKVEPRALEALPITEDQLERAGLRSEIDLREPGLVSSERRQ